MAGMTNDGSGKGEARRVRVTFAPASGHLDMPPLVVAEADADLEQIDASHAVLVQGGTARTRVIMDVVGRGPSIGSGTRREVVVDGWRFELDTELEARASLRERARRGAVAGGAAGPLEVRAVIPGRVLAVPVAAGDTVQAGQPLVVIEAMKMQNEVRAPRDGAIARTEATPGRTVEVGDLLVVLE